jgi:hypothetical protein
VIAPGGAGHMHVSLVTDTVTSALAQLGAAFVGEKLELALVAGALLVQNDAKRLAPIVTGTLRRSIHIGGHTELAPGFNESEGYSDVHGNEVGPASARILVGTDLVYARRIEYGFMGADSLGRHYHQAAQPYLRPALAENITNVEAATRLVLEQLLTAALA